jgi:HAD superfamily phosphoserine phosphatase-like hydrolase
VRAWAPDLLDETEAAIEAGELDLNSALVLQLGGVRATGDEVLAFLRERVVLRAGLPELVSFCRERFIEPVVVSSGFHEVIEPILGWHDVDLPVLAHHIEFSPDGATIGFSERATCVVCGEECKRSDGARLAAGRPVVYAGDGVSDRCAAAAADLVFARAALARYLDRDGVPYEWFDDFGDVRDGIERYLVPR